RAKKSRRGTCRGRNDVEVDDAESGTRSAMWRPGHGVRGAPCGMQRRGTTFAARSQVGAGAWGRLLAPAGGATGAAVVAGVRGFRTPLAAGTAPAKRPSRALLAAALTARDFPARGGGRRMALTKPFCVSWTCATKRSDAPMHGDGLALLLSKRLI